MATANRPNRITLDAFSDPQLETTNPNGVYSQFTNQLQTPILGAKSFELISATFINSSLQLNDQSQLMFFYYASNTQAGIANVPFVSATPSGSGDGTNYTITGFAANTLTSGSLFVISGATGTAASGLNGFLFTAGSSSTVNQIVFPSTTSGTFTGGTITPINLRCVRLLPSSYVPPDAYTTGFTRNKYFNTTSELCAALNTAASTNGDDLVYNPLWQAGLVTFAYDSTTRRISVAGNGTTYISPAAADDPNVLDALRGTTNSNTRIKMKGYNSTGYASGVLQPYVELQSMNARLGFAMTYFTRGLYWSTSSQVGCATSIGIPSKSSSVPVVADANPILLGSQSVGIYVDTVVGGGYDSVNAKNLLSPVFIQVPPLNVVTYVPASVNQPLNSVAQEIYQITVRLVDDAGVPFVQPPNFNTRVEISIGY
jgi:hypothetical protein